MDTNDKEVCFYRFGELNTIIISSSFTTDMDRMVKYADKYGLELDKYEDYCNLYVDLNEFSITYKKEGIFIDKRQKPKSYPFIKVSADEL